MQHQLRLQQVFIPSCIQVDSFQTSEVLIQTTGLNETSEVSPEIDVILIAKLNYLMVMFPITADPVPTVRLFTVE